MIISYRSIFFYKESQLENNNISYGRIKNHNGNILLLIIG